ncbi:hypothetical protein FHR32_005162 [Streptosporangium album]|uniref:DUF2637 domain-containing protein n=1 Tax=Streptosporangium album TaxID=47479 RepID=A0A7W7WBY3_9ACTN|nr:hypothetical protein [Streptosporangium album]MBB4940785.1 hypothetical protein [Streptosporangium album]
MQTITHWLASVPPIWWQILSGAFALGLGTVLAIHTVSGLRSLGRLATRKKPASGADLLTWLAASIATIVSAQGMWQFLDRIIGDVHWSLRALMFAFIEVAVVTSAVRARKNMRENYSAGIDGLAVWALTSLSAVLSAMEAASLPEALFRLAAPLVAAWLWERGMAIERRRATGRKRINWRITPERVLVRVGLAEAQDRTADEVDTRRRFDRVALAAKRVRALREAGAKPRTVARATARLERFYAAAHAHTGIGRDAELQRALASEIASLYSAGALVDLEPASAWTPPAEPSAFAELAEETRRLNDTVTTRGQARAEVERLQAMEANLSMLVADLTGQSVAEVTRRGIINPVNNGVIEPIMIVPPEWTGQAPAVTPEMTSEMTRPDVIDPINFDVNDPAVFNLPWPPPALADMTSPLTPEMTPGDVNDDVSDQSKADVMRAFWEKERVEGRYPRVVDLANEANADIAQASRLRAELVEALPWRERRKATSKKVKAVNGSSQ